MRNRLYGAVILEAALLVALAALFQGGPSASRGAAAAAGGLFMAALAVPSLAVVVLSRGWSQTAAMAALAGVSFGKMIGVAGMMIYVWVRAPLPRFEFVMGMMTGWVLSLIALAVVTRQTMKNRTCG